MTRRLFVGVASVLVLAACPPPLTADPLELAPKVTAFSSSATLVNAGESVTLSWTTEHATSVELSSTLEGVLEAEAELSGSSERAVGAPTVFVLTARNQRGATSRAVVSVQVRGQTAEVSLSATPREIDQGQTVTLVWSAPDATEVRISGASGDVDLLGQLTAGQVTVRPQTSQRYTLTSGTRTAQVDIVVRPTIKSFDAGVDAVVLVDGGASVTLSWETGNAERVRLLSPGRPALIDSTDAGVVARGSFTDSQPPPIDVSRIFHYELEVSGAGRTVVRSIDLGVKGQPRVLTFTGPRYARPGTGITLSWTTTDAARVSLLENGVEVYRSEDAVASGSATLTASAGNAVYELVAFGARSGEARESLEVEGVGLPRVTLSTSPATVQRGQPFTLSWSGQSVRRLVVYGPDEKELYRVTDDAADQGSVPSTLRLGTDGHYRISVDNGLGELSSASLQVPVASAFTFTPSLTGVIPAGTTLTASWGTGETLYGFPHDEVLTGLATFDDISSTGTLITFAATTLDARRIETDFRAPFWGRVVGEEVWVNINGYITFGQANLGNSVDVALPSAKLEPYSLAPFWESLSLASGSVRWQVKQSGGNQVLIVQWTGATNNTFQVKLWSTGQVDFVYQGITGTAGKAGIQGPRGELGYGLPTPTSNQSFTFFSPKSSAVRFTVRGNDRWGGFLKDGANWVPVAFTPDVVRREELQLSEVLIEPAAAVGAAGRWFELTNARTSPLDLTGWSVLINDGGVVPLTGAVPARGTRVFGVEDDRTLNDDVPVDSELSGFLINSDRGGFSIGRDAGFASTSWNNPTTGIATVFDIGPYRFSTDTSTTPARGQSCPASRTYGRQSPPQRGGPGVLNHCGFPYGWSMIPSGFFDISGVGQKLLGETTTAAQFNVSLAAAPFPYFGTPRTEVRLSSGGYLTFDLEAANNLFSSTFPATSAPNAVIAILADDLNFNFPDSGVFVRRMGPDEDPFAAAPHWIFQWHRCGYDTEDDASFQVKLFDDGVIEYHYGKMLSGDSSTVYAAGMSAQTWLENPTGTQALVLNTASDTPGISPFTSFRFVPR